ncbi:uncharacterized protein B0I36DRAFT_368186 [Microdochium trichocladiopsis]|uniref:Uncharacterized protein n=1 Tax=Microdochium trichocladiopsis TaxID=1682393 RepID=A0A9P8XU42_9PEZI|nr:uncharacterized protein B0I36DRAFT_368186 [Microdochium trichocladiopsis]KAH7018143.1 hypothetical protein B0I36DRAFT_368186 [Microdochium trichocladiopsis]
MAPGMIRGSDDDARFNDQCRDPWRDMDDGARKRHQHHCPDTLAKPLEADVESLAGDEMEPSSDPQQIACGGCFTQQLPFLVLLAPWFWGRLQVIPLFWRNAPDVLPRHNVLGAGTGKYEIKFGDRVRSCEDVILLEEQGLAVMGCDPGRERYNTVMGIFIPGPVTSADLYLYDYKTASTPDSQALRRIELVGFDEGRLDFHTLGMGLDEQTGTLFVANHRREAAAGASIEVFRLDVSSPEAPTATHLRTIEHPLIHGPNSLAVVSGTEFFVTNDHYFLVKHHRVLAMLETYLAPPFGTVVHVRLDNNKYDDGSSSSKGVQASVVARLPYANGIEFLNATTLAVASTSDAAVYLYTVTPNEEEEGAAHDAAPPRLAYTGTKIPVPFLPDNLSVTSSLSPSSSSSKKLLIAGHPHVLSTVKYAKTRYICNDPAELASAATSAEQQQYCADVEGQNRATSWVSEWDPATGQLRHLYSGTGYPSSATAVLDPARGVGIMAGLYAKGIMVWRD